MWVFVPVFESACALCHILREACVCLSPSIGTPDEEREDGEAFPACVAEDDDSLMTPQCVQSELGQGLLPLLNAHTTVLVT